MKVNGLDTPALILDRDRLAANVARMSARAKRLGVDLRPHMKTAKSADVARLATAGHSGGITVSTLKEAEYFLENGFRDQTYGVGISLGKLDRVAALQEKGARIAIVTDALETARALGPAAVERGTHWHVFIEIDTGDGRAGILPESDTLLALAAELERAERVTLRGVLTHAGHSYACPGPEGIRRVAEAERAGVVRAAERLRTAGHACPVVSVGSTPTAVHAETLDGVTEMRPGVYMVNDVFQADIGSCAPDDLAVWVLATVIGAYPERGEVMIDAGALALSKDRSTAQGPRDVGYGLVVDAEGSDGLPELHVVRVSQEHGVVAAADGRLPFDRLTPGTRVRVLPNHACMTAAAYDRYHVIDGTTGAVAAVWPRVNGW